MVREEGNSRCKTARPQQGAGQCREGGRQGRGPRRAEPGRGSHEGNEQPQGSLEAESGP